MAQTTYTRNNTSENGYHQISVYDAKTQALLLTYQTTPEGKKSGMETEYVPNSNKVKRQTYWVNGKKDYEKTYDAQGRILTDARYEHGQCVRQTQYTYPDIAKTEGGYKNGKKEGVWTYYAENGTVIKKERYHKGKECTKEHEALKNVAAERIRQEDELSEGKDKRVILPKMTAKEKFKTVLQIKKDLSR